MQKYTFIVFKSKNLSDWVDSGFIFTKYELAEAFIYSKLRYDKWFYKIEKAYG